LHCLQRSGPVAGKLAQRHAAAERWDERAGLLDGMR
jgi:hypothetical protein